MTDISLFEEHKLFKSDIPSARISLLKKLQNSRVSKLARYSLDPPDVVAKEIEEEFHAPASSVFRLTSGCLLITLESGLIVGFSERPSEGSVTVWVEQNENGEKRIEDSILDDSDRYPIDALDKTYSEELIYELVDEEISSISILRDNDLYGIRGVAGEVGVVLNFKNDLEFVIARNLSDNIDDFALTFRNKIDSKVLEQLQEIPI
jgi:hypothetical protein